MFGLSFFSALLAVYSGTVYFLLGFFGASWYGTSTEGNILQNELLGGGVAQTILNFLVAGAFPSFSILLGLFTAQ